MKLTSKALFIPAVVLVAASAGCDRTNRNAPGEATGTAQTHSGEMGKTQGTQPMQPGQQGTGTTAGTGPEGNVTNLPPTEGTLAVKIEGGQPTDVNYEMKGDKIKLSLSSSPNNPKKGLDAIVDTNDQKATLLMNDQKKYAEVDLDQLAKMGGRAKEMPKMHLSDMKKTDTVAGTKCEMLRLQNAQYDVTACAVKGGRHIDLAALEKSGGFTAPPWLSQLIGEGYVPLRVDVKQKGGAPVVMTKVTDFSHQPVADTDFMVPAGYTKTTIPGVPSAPGDTGGNAKGKTNPNPNK